MTNFNPLEPLTSAARQINEQANIATRGLTDSLTQTANALLQVPTTLPLALPLPNGVGNGARRNNPGNGNGNPLNGAFPTLQSLVPTQALQPLTQIEDVVIPAGVPRPSRLLMDTILRSPVTDEPMEVEAEVPRAAGTMRVAGVEGNNGRSATRALGVQAV